MTRRSEHAQPLSHLLDASLRSRDGETLGVVDELLIDMHTGRIEYLLATDAEGERLQFRWDAVGIRNGAFVLWEPSPERDS
jgi:sporulation protein YlmC with PRC-barrel domain